MTTDSDTNDPFSLGPAEPKRLAIRTQDGLDLRAEWAAASNPTATVVLCHPHPLHGGNMYSGIIDHMFQTLPEAGLNAFRFNFRGVTGSEGSHNYGEGEKWDVLASIDAVADLSISPQVVLAGWSFGADVSLAVTHERVAGWFCIAPPLGMTDKSMTLAGHDPRPKLIAVPAHDQFNPPDKVAMATSGWTNTRIETVASTDHFLAGKLATITDLAIAFALSP